MTIKKILTPLDNKPTNPPRVSLHYVGNMQNTYEKGSLHMKREFFCRFGKTFLGK